jgi:hypothetical protein
MVYNPETLTETIIDFSKIKELAEGDDSFIKEMLNLYISQTAGQLIEIKKLNKQKNFNEVSIIFHNMIASFDLIGCESLMNSSRRLENLAINHKNEKNFKSMVDQFINLTEASFTIVKNKTKEEFKIKI